MTDDEIIEAWRKQWGCPNGADRFHVAGYCKMCKAVHSGLPREFLAYLRAAGLLK